MVKRPKTSDILIIALLSILTVLSLSLDVKRESIFISADGKEYYYPADEEREISVEGPLGKTTIEIRDGKARITDSPCPNKTCMTESIGNTITCLPNKVMIINPGKGEENVEDSVAY